jgi:2-hydroxychromene-2-carboxylate isomerase
MKEITFYYDVVCPFAYVASRLIERLAERNAASIRWTPVLLGELILHVSWHSYSFTGLFSLGCLYIFRY